VLVTYFLIKLTNSLIQNWYQYTFIWKSLFGRDNY